MSHQKKTKKRRKSPPNPLAILSRETELKILRRHQKNRFSSNPKKEKLMSQCSEPTKTSTSSSKLIGLGEIAPAAYSKWGKGYFLYTEGCPLGYILPTSHYLTKAGDQANLDNYDPAFEVLVMGAIAPGSEVFMTTILSHSQANELRVRGNNVEQILSHLQLFS